MARNKTKAIYEFHTQNAITRKTLFIIKKKQWEKQKK